MEETQWKHSENTVETQWKHSGNTVETQWKHTALRTSADGRPICPNIDTIFFCLSLTQGGGGGGGNAVCSEYPQTDAQYAYMQPSAHVQVCALRPVVLCTSILCVVCVRVRTYLITYVRVRVPLAATSLHREAVCLCMHVCMYVWMDGWMDGCMYI